MLGFEIERKSRSVSNSISNTSNILQIEESRLKTTAVSNKGAHFWAPEISSEDFGYSPLQGTIALTEGSNQEPSGYEFESFFDDFRPRGYPYRLYLLIHGS